MKQEQNKKKIADSWTDAKRKQFTEKVSADNHWTRKKDMSMHAEKMRSSLTKERLTEIGKNSIFSTNNPMKNPEIVKLYKVPKIKVSCPHCDKTGGKPVMMRYHFDNCKMRKVEQ